MMMISQQQQQLFGMIGLLLLLLLGIISSSSWAGITVLAFSASSSTRQAIHPGGGGGRVHSTYRPLSFPTTTAAAAAAAARQVSFNKQQQHQQRSHPLLMSSTAEQESNGGSKTSKETTKKKKITDPSQLESIAQNAKALLTDFTRDSKGSSSSSSSQNQTATTTKLIQASAAGLAVALAMVPEAIAFAFVAGVSPLVGLWTTVVLGFTAASLGGRAGICSSASGAVSVVIASLCQSHGPAYLSATAIVAGLLQMTAGLAGLGKFIRLVPHPVMLGFVNGLAIVMTKAQLVHFQVPPSATSLVGGEGVKFLSLFTKAGASVYGVTAFTMMLVKLLPRITKIIPPSLGAVILTTLLSQAFGLPVQTLADVAGAETFRGGWSVLPKFGLPAVPLTAETFQIILPYAITMAAVGSIESLLTLQLVDGMVDDGKRGSTSKECIGQGTGNLLSGLFGGIGGCALVGQSVINVQSGGGVSRWSGMSMALFLALGIVAAAPLLGAVPVASLVGVMLLVCQSTFSWSSLRILRRIPKLDALVIALVSVLTVQKDLAYAVVVGTIASALGFAWKQSTRLSATTDMEGNKKLYKLNGPLFFGSTNQFASLFESKSDPSRVVLDFRNSRVMDHSALKAIHTLADQYGSQGKTVYLRHLSKDCKYLLQRLYKDNKYPDYEVFESDPLEDPEYGVAVRYQDVPL